LQDIPTIELILCSVVSSETLKASKASLVQEILKSYGVSSVDTWHEVWCYPKAIGRRPMHCFTVRWGMCLLLYILSKEHYGILVNDFYVSLF